MNKLSKEKRDKILAIGGATLALIGVLWWFLIGGQKTVLEKVAEQASELQEKLDKTEGAINRDTKKKADWAEESRQLQKLEDTLVPASMVAQVKWLLDRLNDLVATKKFDIKDIKVTQPELGPESLFIPNMDYHGAAYRVSFRAYYHEFGRFLSDLENSLPYMNISEVKLIPVGLMTISSASGGGDNLTRVELEKLDVTIRVVLVFKP